MRAMGSGKGNDGSAMELNSLVRRCDPMSDPSVNGWGQALVNGAVEETEGGQEEDQTTMRSLH